MRSFERNTPSPEFPVSFRDLSNELYEAFSDDEANNGRGAVFAMLERWVEPSRQTLMTYSDLKRRNIPEDDYSTRDWSHNLYALSRVNDRLLAFLHTGETRPWFYKSDYVTFFEGIGFSSFERDHTDSVKSLHLSLRINCVQQRRKPVRCWGQRQERNPYSFLCPLGRLILKELTGIDISSPPFITKLSKWQRKRSAYLCKSPFRSGRV